LIFVGVFVRLFDVLNGRVGLAATSRGATLYRLRRMRRLGCSNGGRAYTGRMRMRRIRVVPGGNVRVLHHCGRCGRVSRKRMVRSPECDSRL